MIQRAILSSCHQQIRKNQFSFLFSMRQAILKNTTYTLSRTYDSFELICKDSPQSIGTTPPTVVVAAPPGQPRQTKKREVPKQNLDNDQLISVSTEPLIFRDCKRGLKPIDCSKLIKEKPDTPQCVQLNTDTTRDHVSISIDTKKPIRFSVEEPDLDSFEEHVSLAPGRKHIIDMKLEKGNQDSSNCGPLKSRGRRCAAVCNDRLAIDVCGCSLNADPDMGYVGSMVSVPLCTEQQLRSCVLDQLRSENFFDCMNECKKECSSWRPFTFHASKGSKLESGDYLTLELRFTRPPSDVEAQPMWWNKNAEQMMQVWAPALVVAMLILAVAIVIYLNRCC